MFWLTYCDPSGRLLAVVIQDSGDLIQARLKAAVAGTDQGAQFSEGHELDRAAAKLIPPTAIGRMLDPGKAAAQDRARDPETAASAVGEAAGGGTEAGLEMQGAPAHSGTQFRVRREIQDQTPEQRLCLGA